MPLKLKFVLNIDGICVFAQHEKIKGTDIWVLADPFHVARLCPSSQVIKHSSGIIDKNSIPLNGWAVRIFDGNGKEIPADGVTFDPILDSDRMPKLTKYNERPALRQDLRRVKFNNLPACLAGFVRLRGGTLVARKCVPGAKYGNVPFDIPLPSGGTDPKRLTHRFRYEVDIAKGPVTLRLTRGRRTESVTLERITETTFEAKLVIADIKGHVNIDEADKTTAKLREWGIMHSIFAVPAPVVPKTPFKPGPPALTVVVGDPISGSDPLCPGGGTPVDP